MLFKINQSSAFSKDRINLKPKFTVICVSEQWWVCLIHHCFFGVQTSVWDRMGIPHISLLDRNCMYKKMLCFKSA